MRLLSKEKKKKKVVLFFFGFVHVTKRAAASGISAGLGSVPRVLTWKCAEQEPHQHTRNKSMPGLQWAKHKGRILTTDPAKVEIPFGHGT